LTAETKREIFSRVLKMPLDIKKFFIEPLYKSNIAHVIDILGPVVIYVMLHRAAA